MIKLWWISFIRLRFLYGQYPLMSFFFSKIISFYYRSYFFKCTFSAATIDTWHCTVMNLMMQILGLDVEPLVYLRHSHLTNSSSKCRMFSVVFPCLNKSFLFSIHSGMKQIENQQYLSWTSMHIRVFMSAALLLIWFHFFGFLL